MEKTKKNTVKKISDRVSVSYVGMDEDRASKINDALEKKLKEWSQ